MTTCTAPRQDEIHLWRAQLDPSPADIARLTLPLSSDERERARRFRKESDSTRFVCARGWLRRLLADYLDVNPADLAFKQDGHGKPRVGHPHLQWLRFNLSRSAGMAVFAVARDREVGVDIEEVRHDFPVDEVTGRFFSAREQQALAGLPAAERVDAFFALWSQKEAYLKGLGVGLGGFDGDLATMTHNRKSSDDSDRERLRADGDQWTIASFDAGSGFAAAVAVEGAQVRVPAAAQLLTLSSA